MGFLGGLITAVAGPALGGLISAKATRDTNKWQEHEALKNRQFQKEMSDTAHQREVEDLKAAGLNPILSAGGSGASTPGGSQASLSDMGSSIMSGAATAASVRNLAAITAENTAKATEAKINAKLSKDMYRDYKSNSAKRKFVIDGMLSKKAGVRPEIGTALGAGQSAIKVINNYINEQLDKIPDAYFKGLNKEIPHIREAIRGGKE